MGTSDKQLIFDGESEDFTSILGHDIFEIEPDISNIGDGSKMAIEFADKHIIYAYFVCDSVENVKKNKSLLVGMKIYESPNVAKAQGRKNWALTDKHLVQCKLDLSSYLDLLDLYDLNLINLYYNNELKNKNIKADISNGNLLGKYCIEHKIRVVRRLIEVTDSNGKASYINKRLKIKQAYVQYTVLDTSSVSDIKEIKVNF